MRQRILLKAPGKVPLLPPFVGWDFPVLVAKICGVAAALGAHLEAPSFLPVTGFISRGDGGRAQALCTLILANSGKGCLPSIEMPCLSPVEEE